ncbi:c-type cytochrome [Legionella londiniensis]|uniref:Cytochrome c5 n=1 Tax=Legionella londiniensis TaxID=45068 RepID=A0A0W0VS69_9GAMM|nr:c-type cytochrome [Legionella londiniensis]KTD23056.1 cytochrome c5 [Legionella londiniensis]STX94073.1 cytochrome c5 [Legionella londiniensis]
MRKWFLVGIFCLPPALHAVNDFDREQIQKRIKPLGEVRIKEEDQGPGKEKTEPEAKEVAKKEPAQEIYEQYCQVCHQAGVAGAPKFRDAADWKKRLEEKKLDGLTASAIKGLNAMPPKGTCMQCSDEEIKAAVQYMVPEV